MKRLRRVTAAWMLSLSLALTACQVSFSEGSQQDLPEPTAGTPKQQAEAESAARRYLTLIDARQFDKTWEEAGPALKASSSRFVWTNTLKVASVLKPPSARQVEGFGFTPRVDANAPEGEYVLVQFRSHAGNTTLIEKVVLQKDQGTWKIGGYFPTKRVGGN